MPTANSPATMFRSVSSGSTRSIAATPRHQLGRGQLGGRKADPTPLAAAITAVSEARRESVESAAPR